jgi:uncharacterized CHY-type Zn-finger protein
MKGFKDVEHLVRLAALFLGFVLMFAIVRAEFVPVSFGTLGHYRANAIDDVRARPIVHAGQAACAECHTDVVGLRAQSRHKSIACESCHGPLARHADGSDEQKPARPVATPLCIHCHAANTGKSHRYPTVDIKDHAGGQSCVTCHKPHNPAIS